MAKEIRMPKFGMSMLEGEVVTWFKKEGEQVKTGDELFEVNENKAVHTVVSKHDGILEKIVVKEGESAPVGAILAIIAE
jgi:pyruvate dehydrogenase E2 component (dihydrolipoamide acetyltransferase)